MLNQCMTLAEVGWYIVGAILAVLLIPLLLASVIKTIRDIVKFVTTKQLRAVSKPQPVPCDHRANCKCHKSGLGWILGLMTIGIVAISVVLVVFIASIGG